MEDLILRSFTVGMWEWLSFDSEEMGSCVEICCRRKWSRNESLLAALMQQCVLAQLLL